MREANGHNYLDVLAAMHRQESPEWYLEIGTQTGRSLQLAQCNSVAIDPEFVLKHDVLSGKRRLHMMQQTSDDFFASGFLGGIGAGFDLAFLDGMHLYEFLLRDFMNTELHMKAEGKIVLHDCLPSTPQMAERDRSKARGRAWTGDVWKVIAILQRWRPDLSITIYDAAPTGLAVVENLDPTNNVLSQNYEQIRKEYDLISDCEPTVNGFEVVPTAQSPWTTGEQKLSFAIQLPVPRPRGQRLWGDFHFGVGLMTALRKAGHDARVQTQREWHVVEDKDEIDIVLKGRSAYVPRRGHRTLFWMISSTRLTEAEASAADHVFVAGNPSLKPLEARLGEGRASLLPQAFDAARMAPGDASIERLPPVFVGMARAFERPMIRYILDTQTNAQLWGKGWENSEAAKYLVAEHVANEELHTCYQTGSAVLNDHNPRMVQAGIPSNRIFDALACGAPVITDDVGWFPEEILPFIYVVRDAEEFRAAVAASSSEGADMRKKRREFAVAMRSHHSFDTRAISILERAHALWPNGVSLIPA